MASEKDVNSSNQWKKTENISISSPLWQLFLDSKCSSASIFFKLHLSARSYFHSPTPWTDPRSTSNLSRKVARLMDSFRPGATSYCPFENKSEVAEGGAGVGPPAGSPQDLALLRPSELGLARPAEDRETEPLSLSAQEENRRRLYLNVGRPRPFYGVSQSAVQQAEQDPPNTTTSNQHIKTKRGGMRTLQEIVRNHLVLETGLEKLSRMVKTDQILPQLPPCIRQFLLTFPCQEFEETSDVRPPLAASYHVRCKLDGGHYLAIFATSEMDKATYNVWKDKEDWLKVIDGVQNILATSVDTVTENIFYIVNDHFSSLKTVIETDQEFVDLGDGVRRERAEVARLVYGRILDTLTRLARLGLAYNTVTPHTILLDTAGQIFLQNQLIVKSHSVSENPNPGDNQSGLAISLARIIQLDIDFSLPDEELIEKINTSDKPTEIKDLIIDLYQHKYKNNE